MDQDKEKSRLKRQMQLANVVGFMFLFAALGICGYVKYNNIGPVHSAFGPLTALYIVCAIAATIGTLTAYYSELQLKSLEGRSTEADRVHLGTMFVDITWAVIASVYIYYALFR